MTRGFWLLLALTVVITVFVPTHAYAVRNPGTGGDPGCQTCYTRAFDGETRIACVTPNDGGSGYDKCEVKCYGFTGGSGDIQCGCWFNGYWCMAIMVME